MYACSCEKLKVFVEICVGGLVLSGNACYTEASLCSRQNTGQSFEKKTEDDALSNAGSDGSETLSLTIKKPKKKAKEGLSSEDLKKLATLSLKDKVKMIAQKFEDEDEQVEALGRLWQVVREEERGKSTKLCSTPQRRRRKSTRTLPRKRRGRGR